MAGVIRLESDVGLLTNVRMGVEISVGLAFLTGRRLSLPFEDPIGPAPRSSIPNAERGRPARVLDLLELPVDFVPSEEWATLQETPSEVVEWPDVMNCVCVCDTDIDTTDAQLIDFANGRTRFVRPPSSEASVVVLRGRPLSFYSYFFYARPALRRQLHAVIRGVRPRRPYVELAAKIARDLGRFNALHLRRSDLAIGIPAYGEITPADVATTVASILPDNELLVICSEVAGSDSLFDPLKERFQNIVFATDVILSDFQTGFFSLPRHEDNALGLVTQEIAARAVRFVGTIGSTFTGMIQRQRVTRDPTEPFLYTADFTPPGPVFHNGEFAERQGGCYTWNRIGYEVSPDVLAWLREWPESS
ncbi:MAG: O-fucosyltransferase family protein [Ilumatobacter sp.]|jgi:hypothetical protein|nr:O-fucosyltransferase family protein [Ilumatobacter sp.]